MIFTFDICCCCDDGSFGEDDDEDVPFTAAAATVLFCAYAATLLQSANSRIPKASNSASFPELIFINSYLWDYIKKRLYNDIDIYKARIEIITFL